jgi:type IV pilus assembly protein PilM
VAGQRGWIAEMSEGNNLVGVDIGSSSIKVAEIREGRGGARSLVRFGYHPLPPQTIVDGHVMNGGVVVEGLQKLFHKAKQKDVALRVSGHSVIIKKITMPVMTTAELSEQINWEAEQHIPFDLAEVQIDWQVLTQRPEQGQMDVLLVAAKKEEINDLTNLALEAKLRPRVVDLDAFTVQNTFEAGYGLPPREQTVVLLHVGASLTTLNIIAEGTTSFTRDIANGGNQITEDIQRTLGIGAEEAEAYKCGGDGRGLVPREVPEIIARVVDQIAGEIQRSLDFYLATSGGGEVTRVLVSGGSANIRALLDAIERRCRVPVERLDPIRVAQPDARAVDMALLSARASQASVAMGLALRKDKERRT